MLLGITKNFKRYDKFSTILKTKMIDFTITENFAPYIRTNGTLDLGAFSDHGYQFSHGGGDLYLSSKIGVKYDFNETISIDVSGSIGKVVNEDDSSLDIGAALAFLLNF